MYLTLIVSLSFGTTPEIQLSGLGLVIVLHSCLEIKSVRARIFLQRIHRHIHGQLDISRLIVFHLLSISGEVKKNSTCQQFEQSSLLTGVRSFDVLWQQSFVVVVYHYSQSIITINSNLGEFRAHHRVPIDQVEIRRCLNSVNNGALKGVSRFSKFSQIDHFVHLLFRRKLTHTQCTGDP